MAEQEQEEVEGYDEGGYHYYHYHVPQQSRRDKLRVLDSSSSSSSFFYPPNSPSSHFLSCAPVKLEQPSSIMLNPLDLQPSNFPLSPPPFFYHQQQLAYTGGGEIMLFKPQPLSLSLSSHHNNNHAVIPGLVVAGPNNYTNNININDNNNNNNNNNQVSRTSSSAAVVPMGPFTGYASVLKGSRFLKPAQLLLEEICHVGGGDGDGGDDDVADDPSFMMMDPPPPAASAPDQCLSGDHEDVGDQGVEGRNKSRLLTMLDEVCRRYRQYYQQMHAVVTSFEYVSGLSNAAPYASLAIKTMSKHFSCLKNAITDQLQFANKPHYRLSNRKDESPRFGNTDRGPYGQRSGGFLEHQPVWRPQRGLPERAVSVLRAWLFEHFLHPYPTDTDKLMLAKQTGLSRSQVSNWFINARVRLWKPMVEEIHMLETRQGQKNPQREEHNRNRSSDCLPSLDNSLVSENPSTSTDRFHDPPYKRAMNELPNIPVRSQEHVNLPCTGNQPVGVGMTMAGSASNSVSLTLGLHQNHGIGLAEPYPLSAAQRFGLGGLETNNEGYVMSGFESQNRHFGRDVIGGQLLHDFVG